jgi:hypothetical protein
LLDFLPPTVCSTTGVAANLELADAMGSVCPLGDASLSFSSLLGFETTGGVGLVKIVDGAGDRETLDAEACFSFRWAFFLRRKYFLKSGIAMEMRKEPERLSPRIPSRLNWSLTCGEEAEEADC